MNDNLVNSFISTYEEGTIAGAAGQSGQSKTNIRNHLALLEEELGVCLFRRTHAGMDPTEDGHKIYHIMKYLQFNLNELERFYNLNKESSGLRVATNYIELLAKCFSDTAEKYGDDKSIYTYKTANSDDVLDLLIRDKCDIGVLCFTEDIKEVFIKTCEDHKIYYNNLHIAKPAIYVRKDHPLTQKDSISPVDLQPYKRIGLKDSERKIISYVPSMKKKSIQPNADISVSSVRHIMRFLKKSDYYYISLDPLKTMGFANDIKVIPIKEHVANMYIVWCCKKCYPLNKAGSYFINLVEAFFKGDRAQ